MYSLTGRVNHIGYNGMIVLFVCALLNHVVTRFGHLISPQLGSQVALSNSDVVFQVKKIDYFAHDKYFFDEDALSFTFDMVADLKPLYNWNTNMVFLSLICEFWEDKSLVTVWDQRIQRPNIENHQLSLKDEHIEYYLTDLTKNLKGKEVKVYLRWEHMSTVGLYYADLVEIGKFTAPEKYSTSGKRQYTPGPYNRKPNY